MKTVMDVSVIGLGRLGIPLVACLATRGFRVTGIDIDGDKVRRLNCADSVMFPTVEPRVSEMLRRAVFYGDLIGTTESDSIMATDATIIMVNTPDEPGNAYGLNFVLAALGGIGEAIKDKENYHLVILSSTVMPGVTQGLVKATLEAIIGKPEGENWGLCYVPEFLAIGSAVDDILDPQFILIGTESQKAFLAAYQLYSQLTGKYEAEKYVHTSPINAELAKIALNTAHVCKISFANQWAKICSNVRGADVDEVMDVVGRDERIGPNLLKGSLSFGGPCFPRDARAWTQLSDLYAAPELLPQSVVRANILAAKWLEYAILITANVGIMGMAYKPGVSVAIESLGVALAGVLMERHQTSLRVQDYLATDDAHHHLEQYGDSIIYYHDPEIMAKACDVIVVALAEPLYATLPPKMFEGKMVFDLWRIINPPEDCNYIAVGRGA